LPNQSWRYNYNGGYCGQNYGNNVDYYAPTDFGGPRVGVFEDDIPPFTHGFDYGGAKEFEVGINTLYEYRDPSPYNGWESYPRTFWVDINDKPIYVWLDYEILPENETNPFYGHNHAKIFSYKFWNTTLNSTLPCLTGNMLNHYLSYIPDIIDKYRPGEKKFHSIMVCSRYKDGAGQASTALLGYMNHNSITYDRYYEHYYKLFYGQRANTFTKPF